VGKSLGEDDERRTIEGQRRTNGEKREEEPKVPEEWAEIPIQDYFDKGYRPTIRKSGGKKYIYLRRGDDLQSIGPYTEERWKLLVSMYPRKLTPDIPIKERIEQLKEEGLSREEIARALYNEGYSTQAIMRERYSIRNLAKTTGSEVDDRTVQSAVKGATRGPGYLQELKDMIRTQISLSREFAEACTTAGVKVLFAALKMGGVSEEEIGQITTNVGALENVVDKATKMALKAIEYYDAERIEQLERERDEARAMVVLLEAQLDKIKQSLDPLVRLERMIYNLALLSGTVKVDHNVIMAIMEKWLAMQVVAS